MIKGKFDYEMAYLIGKYGGLPMEGLIENSNISPPIENFEAKKTQIRQKYEVPLWQKPILTIKEAAVYTGIGENKLCKMLNDEECPFVLHNGGKRMVKREQLEKYLNSRLYI